MKVEDILKVIESFNESENVKEFYYETGEEKLELSKQKNYTTNVSSENPVSHSISQNTPTEKTTKTQSQEIKKEVPQEKNANTEMIKSPLVGTFYRTPTPDTPSFVEVGDEVKKGTTLGIIEAMKVMNEIKAEFDLKIVDIKVKTGELVDFDKELFEIIKL